jgi:hypothetical protein
MKSAPNGRSLPFIFLQPDATRRDLRHPHHQPFDVVLLRDGNEPVHHPAQEMAAYDRRQPVIIVLRHMRPCSLSWPAPGASTPSTRTGRKQTLEAVKRAAPRQQTTPEAGQRKSRKINCRFHCQQFQRFNRK